MNVFEVDKAATEYEAMCIFQPNATFSLKLLTTMMIMESPHDDICADVKYVPYTLLRMYCQ